MTAIRAFQEGDRCPVCRGLLNRALYERHNGACSEPHFEIATLWANLAAAERERDEALAALAGCVRYQSMRTHSDEEPYHAAWAEARRVVSHHAGAAPGDPVTGLRAAAQRFDKATVVETDPGWEGGAE